MESMRNQYYWERCFTERLIIVGRNKSKESAKKSALRLKFKQRIKLFFSVSGWDF